MNDWNIIPYIGLGNIRFNLSRIEIRDILHQVFNEFHKGMDSVITTDAYDKDGLHIYYDLNNTCEAIELFKPAKPLLSGMEILGKPYKLIIDWLHANGSEIQYDDEGVISYKYGIYLYVPGYNENDNELVQAVMLFRQGYFDDI